MSSGEVGGVVAPTLKGYPPHLSPAYPQAWTSSWSLLMGFALLWQAHAQPCLLSPPKATFPAQTPVSEGPGLRARQHAAGGAIRQMRCRS